MSIRDLAAQAAADRHERLRAEDEARKALDRENTRRACLKWFATAIGVAPDEVEPADNWPGNTAYVRIEDIWLEWSPDIRKYRDPYNHGMPGRSEPGCVVVSAEVNQYGRRDYLKASYYDPGYIFSLAGLGHVLKGLEEKGLL